MSWAAKLIMCYVIPFLFVAIGMIAVDWFAPPDPDTRKTLVLSLLFVAPIWSLAWAFVYHNKMDRNG